MLSTVRNLRVTCLAIIVSAALLAAGCDGGSTAASPEGSVQLNGGYGSPPGGGNASLEAENERLRKRLARAMSDLHAALPIDQRPAMLLGLLTDPLADVRLAGAGIAYRTLAAGDTISDEARAQIRSMIDDSDPRCRRAGVLLLATLGDEKSLPDVLARLKTEQNSSVRQALLTAAGQLRSPEALEAVLAEIPSRSDEISAAAARALARIIENHELPAESKAETAKVLIARYRTARKADNSASLREALLAAMGQVGDKKLSGVISKALGDTAAAVRLAAVNALVEVGDESATDSLDKLAGDPDRGVRQAAITALGTLGGRSKLSIILSRTDMSVESDAAVRQQAWDAAMTILKQGDPVTLSSVAGMLAVRPDAADQRIQVLGMLVESLAEGDTTALAGAQRKLGIALLSAGRPAEAAPYLEKACKGYAAADNADAKDVWVEWVGALLAADDPAAITAMSLQEDSKAYVAAFGRLDARLSELQDTNRHSHAILLIQEAIKELQPRLTSHEREGLGKLLDQMRGAQEAEDRHQVSELFSQVLSSDETARKTAEGQLRTMGRRALRPLLEQLKEALDGEQPNATVEAAIVALLKQIAPELNGYDSSIPHSEKVQLVDRWLSEVE